MKKLGKLNLKSEKILNQEELVNFRGGSGPGNCETTSSACQACKDAVPYDCQYLGGHEPGSLDYLQCLNEGLIGCCEVAC